jgi:hypothetical protein
MGAVAALAVFVIAALLVLPPGSGHQVSAFIGLMFALMFAMVGIWRHGPRFTVLGLALCVAITGGYLALDEFVYLWFGFVGGGALILAGFWMRRA